ncbi:unnamed protein product [Pleuronectes platessa]|uniref:Uncharacterized protein n=1 Tax=Pleuronectes platessa TaxID=8262 RepID=A0A9N7UL42_PLEPL|nr:unnamed protein product [Pleuronectes platessa]
MKKLLNLHPNICSLIIAILYGSSQFEHQAASPDFTSVLCKTFLHDIITLQRLLAKRTRVDLCARREGTGDADASARVSLGESLQKSSHCVHFTPLPRAQWKKDPCVLQQRDDSGYSSVRAAGGEKVHRGPTRSSFPLLWIFVGLNVVEVAGSQQGIPLSV